MENAVPGVYEVNLYTPDTHEVAALIISAWACPTDKPTDTELREQLYLSLCSLFIRDRAARDPDWAQQPQWINPNQACRAEKNIQRDIRTLGRRIKDRVAVGNIAVAFLQEAETGITPELAKDLGGLSINKMSEYALEGRKISDTVNFKSRIWAMSRPVVHLCAAWAVTAQEHFKEYGTQLDLIDSMRRPEFLAPLLHRAAAYEPLVERSAMTIAADELIRFRLVRGGFKKN
jgi:hypothetical protein